ncbi:hypothetical protein M408DRAFT_28820 [Serendipita vermifera MAFF 305830]|uniref:Uncharacterized protein n=1 Tax=Serendipita vermifera MAFF 305830 TaxID=933852 RepID=A0A0C3AC91_SERVB|nr:hypothetical protein M408DRAFT_28820 [Serendipita vermifera MAFF 305830]
MAVGKRGKNSKYRRVTVSSTLFANDFCHDASTKVRKQRSLKKYRRQATRRDSLNDNKLRKLINQLPPCRENTRIWTSASCSSSRSPLENILNLSWKLPGDMPLFTHQKLCPLLERTSHFEYALRYTTAHIPETWKVFQTVDWTAPIKFLASSNSSRPQWTDSDTDKPIFTKPISNSSCALSSQSPTPTPTKTEPQVYEQLAHETGSPLKGKSASQDESTAILFRKDTVLDARTRNQWNFVATMKPARFQWRHQTPKRALRRDRRRHTSYLDLNQSARNEDLWPQVAGPPFLSFENADTAGYLLEFVYEQSLSCLIGRRLVGLVQTEAFPAYYQHVTKWPPRISAARRLPTVDYICRATPKAMGWHENICPVLFVAHSFPFEIGVLGPDIRPVTSKLAAVLQPTISLFILYYLDTRATFDEPIPHWMILFGATYNEATVEIWAHHPWLLGPSGEEDREEECIPKVDSSFRHNGWSPLHPASSHITASNRTMAIDKREKNSKSRRVAVSSTLFANDFCHDASTKVRKQRSLKKYRRHATRRDPLEGSKLRDTIGKLPVCRNNTRRRMPARCSPSPSPALEHILNLSWKLPGDSIDFIHEKLSPLYKHRRHLEYALSHSNGPQIPDTWKIFQTVDWAYWNKPLASSSSSCTPISDSDDENPSPSKSTPRSSRASSSKGPSSTDAEQRVCPQSDLETGSMIECKPRPRIEHFAIVFRKDTVLDMRTRNQWNFMATLKPNVFKWRRQTKERALRRDMRRHAGFWDLNQSARNQDLWPQVAGPPFLSFNNVDASLRLLPLVYEQSWPCVIGRRLVDLVQTEAFPARYQHATQWPRRMSAVGRPPSTDYVCRAIPEAMGWQEEMCPVLFVVQSCPCRLRDCGYDTRAVTAKLAAVFQPMISLFILYYLDTRVTPDAPIPPWMILFGATYSQSEVKIYAHYPWLLEKSGEDREEEWCALSEKVASYAFRVWQGRVTERGVLLGALNRIQGHCKYVMHQLKAWDGYDRAYKLLGL